MPEPHLSARFDSLDPPRGSRSFRFEGLESVVVARRFEEVVPALERVEALTGDGLHAAGFLAYEAGPALEGALAARVPSGALPLLAFGIFRERIAIEPLADLPAAETGLSGPLEADVGPAEYRDRIARILELIAAGDTYQVNYTFRLRGSFTGDDLALYRDLCLSQRAAYCAHLALGDTVVISASPELFFRIDGRDIELRPMKGTRPRGRWSEEDEHAARSLSASEKDRAENLMIVDLIRNDVGRVAEIGSVEVPRLFEVETYPTVLQLTSTVRARIREGQGLTDIIRALFPSGSVTGAPKIRTSQIIRDLEDSPRGVYTGAIGFVSPDEAVFSVAIRTLVLDRASGRFEVGVGSGITADSDAEEEYRECLGKGAFLTRRLPDFALLESLRLERTGRYPLLERHLDRLGTSARYFGFPFDPSAVREALVSLARLNPPGTYKVRLTLSRRGEIATEAEAIPETLPPARVRLASRPVDETDPLLYHKTTHRTVYEAFASEAGGCDDVILYNRRGELTESTRANLVLELDGELVTPPVACGLLSGVMRAELLREGRVRERTLIVEDLDRADRIHLVNAVRGWREAVRVDLAGTPTGVSLRS